MIDYYCSAKTESLFAVLDDSNLGADWDHFSDTVLLSLSVAYQQPLSIEAITESPVSETN
jgi:hypothetical protein